MAMTTAEKAMKILESAKDLEPHFSLMILGSPSLEDRQEAESKGMDGSSLSQFQLTGENKSLLIITDNRQIAEKCKTNEGEKLTDPVTISDVGDCLKYVYDSSFRLRFPGEEKPPSKLAGAGKLFEEELLRESKRLKNKLVMGRYGTMVSLVNNVWMPIPSLPDFEGVTCGGRQFIIEAKVCSRSCFRMGKATIKHKQVKHMITRSHYGVPCYLFIHFNERIGKTFYDQPFTVSIPVKSASEGGWEVFEKYAEEKDKTIEMESITRDLARDIGTRVPWFMAARRRKASVCLGTGIHLNYD